MTSVRFPFRIFNRLKKKQRRIDRVAQFNRANLSAAQIGGYDGLTNGLSSNANSGAGYDQTYINQANNMAGCRNQLEEYYGGVACANKGQNLHSEVYGSLAGISNNGFVAHDGSSKIFVWDATKGCMAPYRESIGRRLRRSVDAFARAWRLGHG